MSFAYYNEIDPFAAAWLTELIREGHVADGVVDTRSITEVDPADLVGFTQHHFFAGIGGWSLALRLAGWPDDHPVWTGSCPCQPFSAIGKRQGIEDDRHLWPAFFRLIAECRPAIVFGEQVASDDGLAWLDGVCADLEGSGYAVGAADLCAASVGAPHIRQRLYWLGHALGAGLEGYTGHGDDGRGAHAAGSDPAPSRRGTVSARLDAVPVLRRHDVRAARGAHARLRVSAAGGVDDGSLWAEFDALACSDGWRRVQSGAFPMAHGVSGRVGRLRGYGNAIVPAVAATFIQASADAIASGSARP